MPDSAEVIALVEDLVAKVEVQKKIAWMSYDYGWKHQQEVDATLAAAAVYLESQGV